MFIYSVYDKKALSFSPLFTAENHDVAKRQIIASINSSSLLSVAPADFSLYCLGKYNSDNGDVSGITPVELVCEVLSLVKVDENSES